MQKCRNARRLSFLAFLHFCIALFASPSWVSAGERYALVITGASGGEVYAEKYNRWRSAFVTTLRTRLGYGPDRVFVLAEQPSDGVSKATRENVQRLFEDFRKKLSNDDQLLVLLIGHGTSSDYEEGKFNLVGPDLKSAEWADLLRPIAGRVVFVNTSSASFPFLRRLAGRGRIVLTATDSSAQQFETVFPEFFVKAFEDSAADVDKNNRVSIWEAFSYASAGVRQWFEQHAQLQTERPLLDDTGAGVGQEAQNPGADGGIARATYLDADPSTLGAADAALAALLKRRADLEREVEGLRARRAEMTPAEYEAALERLLLAIAQLSQQIRVKS